MYYDGSRQADFSDLQGEVLTQVSINDSKDEVLFICESGRQYKLLHFQDCCEGVYLEDVCGEWEEVLRSVIISAEEVVHEDNETPPGMAGPEWHDELFQWTFYKLLTIRGSVTLRWYGSSNGYYSVSVDFIEVT